MKKILTKQVRAYIYAIAIAFLPLAVYLGWIEPEALPLVIPLVLAILNLTPDDAPGQASVDG